MAFTAIRGRNTWISDLKQNGRNGQKWITSFSICKLLQDPGVTKSLQWFNFLIISNYWMRLSRMWRVMQDGFVLFFSDKGQSKARLETYRTGNTSTTSSLKLPNLNPPNLMKILSPRLGSNLKWGESTAWKITVIFFSFISTKYSDFLSFTSECFFLPPPELFFPLLFFSLSTAVGWFLVNLPLFPFSGPCLFVPFSCSFFL